MHGLTQTPILGWPRHFLMILYARYSAYSKKVVFEVLE